MNNLRFARGLKETYDKSAKDGNTIYFCTDTQEIYVGGVRYGIGKLSDDKSVYIDKYKIMMGE